MITLGHLRIDCRFAFTTVLHCNIRAKYGEHTRAEIIGTVKNTEVITALKNKSEDELIITSRGNDDIENILFTGILEFVELKQEGQYALLTVRATSYTWKMDIKEKCRSFQDLSMTYRDVAERVVQECDAVMSWNLSDKLLEYPLIQYKETDYCFLKRILSHLGGDITSADIKAVVNFNAGLREGSYIGAIDLTGKTYSVALSHDKKFVGYKIENMDFARIGDSLAIQGQIYYIMELEAVFQNNTLNCAYFVLPRKSFEVERIPANSLKGTAILGKVLKAKREKVKLHLEIDSEQMVETAYDFPWEPITGNLLYSMPEEGSRVALYFKESEEKNAAAIYNIRENGEECEETADCNERYFTTRHEKRMYLKPSQAGFINISDPLIELSFSDDSRFLIESSHKISIIAEGRISLKGKNIKMNATKEATLVKKDIIAPTVINLCNAFDAIGTTGSFAAIPKTVNSKRKSVMGREPIKKYALDGVVEAVLSSIPAVELESQLMEAVAGSMPVVSRNIR